MIEKPDAPEGYVVIDLATEQDDGTSRYVRKDKKEGVVVDIEGPVWACVPVTATTQKADLATYGTEIGGKKLVGERAACARQVVFMMEGGIASPLKTRGKKHGRIISGTDEERQEIFNWRAGESLGTGGKPTVSKNRLEEINEITDPQVRMTAMAEYLAEQGIGQK